jgi:hypothetical protein
MTAIKALSYRSRDLLNDRIVSIVSAPTVAREKECVAIITHHVRVSKKENDFFNIISACQ